MCGNPDGPGGYPLGVDISTADGVRMVPPDAIPARIQAIVESAREFVLLVGVPLHGNPELDAALRRVARGGGTVRIVVSPEQGSAAAREIIGLSAEGAEVLVSRRPRPVVAATEEFAIEVPAAYAVAPGERGLCVVADRSRAGVRWTHIAAHAKIAGLCTRRAPPERRVVQPSRREPWAATFRALFRS